MSKQTLVLVLMLIGLSACGSKADEDGGGTGGTPATPAAAGTSGGGAAVDPATADAVAQADAFIATLTIDKAAPRWKTRLPKPPKFEFHEGESYKWILKTNKGTITIRLWPDVAPMHVSSTIYLTRLGFYDGITFHRVITDFMAQGGDPLGNGSGGPGYQYDGEFSRDVLHDRPGLLSMANAGPGTDGSQFFLTFKPTEWLNGKHTLFGEVISGEDVVNTFNSLGSQGGTPQERLFIEKATIEVEK